MTRKDILTYILITLAVAISAIALSLQYVEFWWYMVRPYYAFWMMVIMVALVLVNINVIRRLVFPMFTCSCAWLYKHKLLKTKFTKSTYLVYEMNHHSYRKLYKYVQALFDAYIWALNNTPQEE